MVVDRNGYILTNNHVVEKATRVQVKFNGDPTEYDAKVVGTDPATDVAVLKVDRPNLVAAKIGNSDAVQVGDWAVAIGSPFGFQATVTAGIISAKSRDIPGDNTMNSGFQHFMQTDAAINPGNSGGPLAEHQRRSDRHQHHDRQPQRRVPGHRFRAAYQYRRQGLQPDHQDRQSDARIDRYPVLRG